MSDFPQCALLLGVLAMFGCNEPVDLSQEREDMALADAGGMAQSDSAQPPADVAPGDVTEDVDGNPCPADIVDPDECQAHEGCRVYDGAPLEVSDGMCTERDGAKPIPICGRGDVQFINNYPPQEWIYWREVAGRIEYVRVLKYGGEVNGGWTFCGAQATDPLVKSDPPPTHNGVVLDGCDPEICFMGPIL